MTQYRKDPDRLSNWFDERLNGIGHRGSSFSDIDGYVHDKRTDRILIMEFKWEGNPLPEGQAIGLKAFARKPDFTVWCLKRLNDDRIKALEVGSEKIAVITCDQLRAWFAAWWSNQPVRLVDLVLTVEEHLSDDEWNRKVDREIAEAEARDLQSLRLVRR